MSHIDNIHTRSLITKFFGTAGIRLLNSLLSVITGITLARVLGPEEFGRYGLIMSIIVIASIPTIAGIPQLIIREVANYQLEKKWSELKGLMRWSSIYVVSISTLVICILALAIDLQWIEPRISLYLWFGLAIIPMKGVLAKQNAVLNGLRFPILAQLPGGVISSILVLIIMYYLLFMEHSLDAQVILLVQVCASLGSVIVGGYLIFYKNPRELSASSRVYKVKHWHSALLPFTFLTVLSTLNNELASVMLGYLGTEEDVGYFKVAMQGVALLSLGLASINTITGPNIARLYKKGDLEGVQQLLTKSVRLSALTSLPSTLFLIFFGDWIVVLFFGKEYLPAANLLTILCIGQIVNVLMGSAGLVLQMTGHEKLASRTLVITLFITILLLAILIPMYKDTGAAVAASFGLILWNVMMARDVNKHCKLQTWVK